MKRLILAAVLALGATLTGCEDQLPTSADDGLIPVTARTVEVRLPYESFATDLRILGGYGSPAELGQGVAARDFQGSLNARTLSRFGVYPQGASVRDSTGSIVADSSLTYLSGYVVAQLDTVARPAGPVTLRAGALRTSWHAPTASWDLAVDTLDRREAWPEPGGGPVSFLDSAEWDPGTEGDTVAFEVDSATVAAWADTSDVSRGIRIELETAGERVRIRTLNLRLRVQPSVNPDTTVIVTARPRDLTFVYDPLPDPPPDGLRVGGAPAWRSIFRLTLPETLSGPPELCEAFGCPFQLNAESVSFASLVLTSRVTPAAFQPEDTLAVDVRTVLRPDRLPKSPLGSPLAGALGRDLPPEYFSDEAEQEIQVPLTPYIRNLIRDATTGGDDVPSTLALLSTLEPVSMSFLSFYGPGDPRAPVLRLVLTRDTGVGLP